MDQRRKAIQETEQRISRLEFERDAVYTKLGELAWQCGALGELSVDLRTALESLDRAETSRARLSAEYDQREEELIGLDEEAKALLSRRSDLELREAEASKLLGLSVLSNASRLDLPSLDDDINVLRDLVETLARKEKEIEEAPPVEEKPGFFAAIGRSISRSGKRALLKASIPGIRRRVDAQAIRLGRAAVLIEPSTWDTLPACKGALQESSAIRLDLDDVAARLTGIERIRQETLAWLKDNAGFSSWQAARKALENARKADTTARDALFLEAGTLLSERKNSKKTLPGLEPGSPEAIRLKDLTSSLGECMISIADARNTIALLEAEIQRDALLKEKESLLESIRDHEERMARSSAEIASSRQRIVRLEEDIVTLEEKLSSGKA